MEKIIPYKFETTIDSMEKVSPTISKCRLKIFYKYKNRNMAYITDEFAEQLLSTLPYAPVVGIYSEDDQDFKSHSYDPSEARMYGLVPEDPKVEWGTFVDKDGMPRTYASCEVYFYTKRYPITNNMIGKNHSMELDPDSVDGAWRIIGGREYFVYTNGAFLGLSILGDKFEPCFEGSSFYSKDDGFFELVKNFGEYMYSGGQKMEELIEPAADFMGEEPTLEERAEIAPEVAENPAPEVEAAPEVDGDPEALPDDFAGKEDEIDFKAEIAARDDKILELEQRNITLATELENANAECKKAKAELEEAQAECKKTRCSLDEVSATLAEYVNKEKESVIAEYSERVNADTLSTIRNKMESFSAKELEKELLFALKQENPNCFAQNAEIAPAAFKVSAEKGINSILENYKNKQN